MATDSDGWSGPSRKINERRINSQSSQPWLSSVVTTILAYPVSVGYDRLCVYDYELEENGY